MGRLCLVRRSAVRAALAPVTLCAVLLLLTGCKAKQPGKLETNVANWTKRHVTVGGKKDKNPFPQTAEHIAAGKATFAQACSVCHGLDGQNTGVPFALKMAPQVPDLTSDHVQRYTDGQLHSIIRNGLYPSGMPAMTDDFSDDDAWEMVAYIRHLPKKGSLGDPPAYGR
jgi:mono/diheme cytochrome c family protein